MSETFADVLAYGGGRCEFRLVIEGCPLEFCTHPSMRGVLASGVRRVDGLARDGLSFMESVDIPRAEHKSSIGSVTIEDTDDTVAWNKRAASYAFSKIARTVGYLASGCTASDTTLYVRSSAGLAIGTVYHLDTEAVLVTAIGGDFDTELTVTRGMWGTTAQAHFVAASTLMGDRTLTCPIYDSVPTYRRRRVWVYGHGADELTTSDTGTLLARGIVSTPPQLTEGTTWSLSISPLTSLLDAEIGPIEGSGQVTGIYHPGATPFRMTVHAHSGAEFTTDVTDSISVTLVGIYRSQSAWCEALTTALNAAADTAAWTERFSAREAGPVWELYVQTAASASERYFTADGGCAIDGVFTWAEGLRSLSTGYTARVTVVSPSTEYRFGWAPHTAHYAPMGWAPPASGLRGFPRSSSFPSLMPPSSADVATYPWHRLYLATVAGASVGQMLRVTQAPLEAYEGYAWEATITVVDADEGYVEWDPDTMRRVDSGGPVGLYSMWTEVTPGSMPTIMLPRAFGDGGNVADMIEAVWNAAPAEANGGAVPFVLQGDFASADTLQEAVLEAAVGAPWLLHRRYVFCSPVRLIDVIKHELRLLGAFLATDANGAITIRPITTRLDSDATIASSDLVNDESFGDIVTQPDGILTGYTIRTAYDSIEDEHKGRVINTTHQSALALQRTRQALEIAPKSNASGTEPTPEEIVDHLGGVIALWSSYRAQATFDVKLTRHAVRLGDCTYVTIPQLPYDGERSIDGGGGGMIGIRGTVVGRRWAFADPCISLTVLFDSLDVAGYTPTGRVVSYTGSGTTTVTVTLDADEYGPGGAVADADFFVTGMKARLVEWDTDAPTIRTGTVTGVAGNVVSLTMDSAWTAGTSTWNLLFSPSTTASITTAQLAYAWIARDDLRVHLASGTQSPKVFAP